MTTAPQRKRTRGASRAESSVEIDDDQLVEVAELGARPRARVALHDVAGEHVTVARATIAALGHELVAAGAGKAGLGRVVEALRADRPPEVVVVGLPGGEPIIDAARALDPRRPVLVAVISGPPQQAGDRAHAAGADLFTLRPHDADHLGPVLLAASALAAERARLLVAQGTEVLLRSRLARLAAADSATGFQTFDSFRRLLELELKRARRYGYALSVCQLAMVPPQPTPAPAILHELRVRAAAAITSAIRDIDFPVEISDERFLVLLPYTDAAGAALVARRVVAAVAAAPDVRSSGQSYRPAVAAGVAGVAAGVPISMARLMRDAGGAVLEARRRGVALVVA